MSFTTTRYLAAKSTLRWPVECTVAVSGVVTTPGGHFTQQWYKRLNWSSNCTGQSEVTLLSKDWDDQWSSHLSPGMGGHSYLHTSRHNTSIQLTMLANVSEETCCAGHKSHNHHFPDHKTWRQVNKINDDDGEYYNNI